MRHWVWVFAIILAGCSGTEKKAAVPVAAPATATITQFYSTTPSVAKGEKALLCYGVENATKVWAEPPRQELSVALSRCFEVNPEHETTYLLTAVGPDGKEVTRDLKIGIGAAKVKIVNLNVSALQVKPGDMVSVCYTVANAQAVEITPIGYHGGQKNKGCATDQPHKSTTYVVRAVGSGGDKDEERVTVAVK